MKVIEAEFWEQNLLIFVEFSMNILPLKVTCHAEYKYKFFGTDSE
jgi:hypothetical protein